MNGRWGNGFCCRRNIIIYRHQNKFKQITAAAVQKGRPQFLKMFPALPHHVTTNLTADLCCSSRQRPMGVPVTWTRTRRRSCMDMKQSSAAAPSTPIYRTGVWHVFYDVSYIWVVRKDKLWSRTKDTHERRRFKSKRCEIKRITLICFRENCHASSPAQPQCPSQNQSQQQRQFQHVKASKSMDLGTTQNQQHTGGETFLFIRSAWWLHASFNPRRLTPRTLFYIDRYPTSPSLSIWSLNVS